MGRKQCPLLFICEAKLPLNNTLPADLACIWVTPEELHEQLVHAGVCKILKLSLVVLRVETHRIVHVSCMSSSPSCLLFHEENQIEAHNENVTMASMIIGLPIGI